MLQITLTPDEASMLHEILTSFLGDLRMEIVDTESWEFREALKKQEEFIKKLLTSLSGA